MEDRETGCAVKHCGPEREVRTETLLTVLHPVLHPSNSFLENDYFITSFILIAAAKHGLNNI